MSKFLLSVHMADGEAREPMSQEEMQRSWQRISELEAEMKTGGAWHSSARLTDAASARVVRVAGGTPSVTDGPFVETKEHLGGFYIIEADDLDAALDWATKVTAVIAAPIEVRPFADFAD